MGFIVKLFSIFFRNRKDEDLSPTLFQLLVHLVVSIFTFLGTTFSIVFFILFIVVAIFSLAPTSLAEDGDPMGNYESYATIVTDEELITQIALESIGNKAYDYLVYNFDLSPEFFIAVDSALLNLRYNGNLRGGQYERVKQLVLSSLKTSVEEEIVVETAMVQKIVDGKKLVDKDGLPIMEEKITERTEITLRISNLSESEILSNLRMTQAEVGQYQTFRMSLDSGILGVLDELYTEPDTYIESGSVAGIIANSFEGKDGKFEYNDSLFAISKANSLDTLNKLYGGSLDVDFKEVIYPDGTKINAPIFEDPGTKGGVVGSGVYSLAVIDSTKLKPIPTQYTGGGTLYADERVIPILTKMLDDMKKAGLSDVVVVDAYRSQTRQAVLFVTASCNRDARRLNANNQVQRWIASQTGKTIEQLKQGDTSGIDFIKLNQKIASAPNYIKEYNKYVAVPRGTNSHSTGRAFDFAGITQKHKIWMKSNVSKYGFWNYDREIWHWEYNLQ